MTTDQATLSRIWSAISDELHKHGDSDIQAGLAWISEESGLAIATAAATEVAKATITMPYHSVDEMTPPPCTEVLAFHSDGVDRACLYGSVWRLADYSEHQLEDVSHWCDLPGIPEHDNDASNEPARDRAPDPLLDDGDLLEW